MPSHAKRQFLKWSLAASAAAALSACGGGGDDHPDIVGVAQADPQFSTLVEALAAADLVGTLQGTGPFTVFAPTNAAFAGLLAELGLTKEALLADKALLGSVLSYHVVPGNVPAASVPLGQAVTTVQGGVFKVENNAGLKVTDGRNRVTNITATDVQARNGVIHVVDRVLLPANRDIVETAQAVPELSILVEAVVAAGLVGTLQGAGPFTVFAPTNAAFAALLAELGVTKAALLADTALLTRVLTYHVVTGRVLKAALPVGAPISTVQGQTFSLSPALRITDRRGRSAGITATDILTRNGVVHLIDKVLLPAA